MPYKVQQLVIHLLVATTVVISEVLTVAAAEVALMPVALPRGPVVVLGDVAKVQGANAKETARLSAVPLFPAPVSGRKKFVRMREIQDLLVASGEELHDLHFRGELLVEIAPAPGSEQVRKPPIDRRAVWSGTSVASSAGATEVVEPQSISRGADESQLTATQVADVTHQIEGVIYEHLRRYSGRVAEWRVVAEIRSVDMPLVLAAKTPLQCSGGVSPWTGLQRFVIAFSTERGVVRVRVAANITATQPVVVAARPIERGRVITAADVAVQHWDNVPVATNRRPLLDSIEEVIGLESARAIQVGDAVSSDDARPQYLVKRGDEITVVARGGGIQVRSIARAKQNGARGELIAVESFEKELYEAVVTGVREAMVYTGSKTTGTEEVAQQPFRKLRQK